MADENNAGVLDAINDALGVSGDATSEHAETPPPEETETTDEGQVADGSAAEGTEEKPDGEKAEGEKPEGEKAKNEEGAEKKPEKSEAKKPDHINDPIPKELSQETQTRMRSLIRTAKEATAAREKVQTDFDYLVNGVKATGASPQQYGEVLSWLSLFNSGNPQEQAKALELIEDVADRLAMLLGKTRTVKDALAGHADLADAVQKGQMTREWATQLATQRNASKFRTDMQTQQSQEQQTQQTQQQELAQARTDLTNLEKGLRMRDPRYEEKKALIVPALQAVMKQIPPRNWKAAFQQAYDNVHLPAAPGSGKGSGVPANQQQRPKGGAGGGGSMAKPPGSLREAIDGALASISRR